MAVGGGVSVQAIATAIVGVHILSGVKLDWLKGICVDIPTAVWAESEGPGDDLRIELGDAGIIEVQVKKGLKGGSKLWTALLSLAREIYSKNLPYGVLVVASDSSSPVRDDLPIDMERLGNGRIDLLSKIGVKWKAQLEAARIPAEVCRCIRIKVINVSRADEESIRLAKKELHLVCAISEDIDKAWNYLYSEALHLISIRGRWTLPDLIRHLSYSSIPIKIGDFPASLFQRHTNWIIESNQYFSLAGLGWQMPLIDLLPMSETRRDENPPSLPDALSALNSYHSFTERRWSFDELDAVWTARFKRLVVVVAGPGLGKSTMIKALAYQYARSDYLVLCVSLKWIERDIKNGSTFSDSLFKHALNSSPLTAEKIQHLNTSNWVLLADGLDECGRSHDYVAEQLRNFAIGRPEIRIVVTTRPIGYETSKLSNWQHYNLLPPRKQDGSENLAKLVHSALQRRPQASRVVADLDYSIAIKSPSDAISISPQLLGMATSLLCGRRKLPATRVGLYSELLNLFEKPATDKIDLFNSVLDVIGWTLSTNPVVEFEELINITSRTLQKEIGMPLLPMKADIRLAVEHWERVGVIEKVFHDGIVLLTFIHKTFCEFSASRFLVAKPLELFDHVVDQQDKREIIDFAIGQGIGHRIIELYLNRHDSGISLQLKPALAILRNKNVTVPNDLILRLVFNSFKAIEDGVNDKFSIGIALTEIGRMFRQHVEEQAIQRLNAENSAVRLVAWAVAVACDSSKYDDLELSEALASLLKTVKKFEISDFLRERKIEERELLQGIAIESLKSQPDECLRSFAEKELQDEKLLTPMFSFKVNSILKSRNIEPLPLPFFDDERKQDCNTRIFPIGPTIFDISNQSLQAIAKVFATSEPLERGDQNVADMVQFSAFIQASGFYQIDAHDRLIWLDNHDEKVAHTTIKTAARFMGFDMHVLQQDATELLRRSELEPIVLLIEVLPKVDVPDPDWEGARTLKFDTETVLQGLLHPSNWINYLSTCLFLYRPIPQSKLENLLLRAKGRAIGGVVTLIQRNCDDSLFHMLLCRLNADTAGDVSIIFNILSDWDISSNSELIETVLANLYSNDSNTARSAANLLNGCSNQSLECHKATIEAAIEHWGGRDSWRKNPFAITPVQSIMQLLDKIAEV